MQEPPGRRRTGSDDGEERRTEKRFVLYSDLCRLNEAKLEFPKAKDENRKAIPPLFSFVVSYSRLGDESNQVERAISTGQLLALLRVHIRPIDVVVFHGSSKGELVLRLVSRLDAFSGYPFRI